MDGTLIAFPSKFSPGNYLIAVQNNHRWVSPYPCALKKKFFDSHIHSCSLPSNHLSLVIFLASPAPLIVFSSELSSICHRTASPKMTGGWALTYPYSPALKSCFFYSYSLMPLTNQISPPSHFTSSRQALSLRSPLKFDQETTWLLLKLSGGRILMVPL